MATDAVGFAREILTIPAHRPIKPVYIRKSVRYIDTHGDV
jgi:hypothetical protein